MVEFPLIIYFSNERLRMFFPELIKEVYKSVHKMHIYHQQLLVFGILISPSEFPHIMVLPSPLGSIRALSENLNAFASAVISSDRNVVNN